MEYYFLRPFFYSRKRQINDYFDDRRCNFSEEFNIFRDMISQCPKFREKVTAFNSRFGKEKETW